MFNSLKLYYLQQLGIRPWVRRARPILSPKVVVIAPSLMTEKAKQLFNHILAYFPQENVVVFSKEHFSIPSIPSLAKAILVFDEEFSEFSPTCPLFKILDLDMLLARPQLKKEVFKTLQQLSPLLVS